MENNEVVQEAVSKDFQIKFLEEKLAFMQKQLDDKDVQLDHYKSLLRAMQEVLNKQASPSRETKPPPGFEKNSISKARKMHSFHVDPSAHHLEEEDIQYSHVIVEDFEEYEKDMARRQQIESELVQRSPGSLKKSRSHTSFAHLRAADSPPMSASTSSLPNLPSKKSPSSPYVGLSPVREDESWKSSKLKKSQSMTSMYSALDENRLDFKFPELSQMVGQIYQLSRYQQGCRFLQKKLEEDPKNAATILKELSDHLVELMTDPFGNYLFTKLVEHCDMEQRSELLQKILPDISQVAFDMYGTQSLQKMMQLGTLAEGQIEQIVEVLKPQALALIKHNKANYLIQYCLDRLPEQYNKWIYDSVAQHMEEISRDRVGCVIVKRCIDHATENQMGQLHATIQKVALRLVQDPFGNYVAQHVLQKFPGTEQANKLAATLVGSITELCIQKFSSNVVEKCLKVADEETKKAMLKEITESEMLPQLLNDRFANFVIQTALDVADQEQRAELVKNILPHLGKHYSPYTKRLQKKILQV